jgi:signal transduction histidine kinase
VGLYLGVGTPAETALARVRTAFWTGVGWLTAGTLLALAVAWVGGVRFIRRPIAQLVRTAARWSEGDYAARAQLTDRHSEIGQLGATFDNMADRLDRRERELREATRAKSRLLAAAGHDFKQPLQTISMSVDRLSGDPRTVERVHRMVDRIARSIDQLLIASRIELGTLQPVVRDVSLGAILADAREICAPAALEKEVEFRLVGATAWVRTDPDMILTILINLIGNAVKYTDRGRVLVGCRRRGDRLALQVHDTGVGIPEDQLPRIFEEFQRLQPTRGGGYGLGLSIVRRTAELLGHKVSVRSVVGRGSCFEIELPVIERPAPASSSAAAAS